MNFRRLLQMIDGVTKGLDSRNHSTTSKMNHSKYSFSIAITFDCKNAFWIRRQTETNSVRKKQMKRLIFNFERNDFKSESCRCFMFDSIIKFNLYMNLSK